MQPLMWHTFNRSSSALDTTLFPTTFGAASANDTATVKMTGTSGHYVGGAMPIANYAVEAEFKIDDSDDQCGAIILGARYLSGAHYALAWCKTATTYPKVADGATAGLSLVANKLYLVKSTGAAATELAVADLTFTKNVTYRVRLVVAGTSIEAYVNDQRITYVNDSAHAGPGSAVFGHVRATSGGSTNLVTMDNLTVTPLGVFPRCEMAYDEVADILKIAMPDIGSASCRQIFNYHMQTRDWTIEDLPTTCLFSTIDDTNRTRVIYGEPSNGNLYIFDDTATRSGASYTATWTSNWLQIDPTRLCRSVVHTVKFLTSLDDDNQFQATVIVAEDPDDPNPLSIPFLIAGYNSHLPFWIGQRGNFVKVSIQHVAGTLKLRGIELEVAS